MSGMRALSLCSGIGGLDLAAEWAGVAVIGQVEIDGFCRAVLAKHWPGVPRYADLREVRGNECGPVDLVFGGFPCQPVSGAGQRRGASDDRWLWPEVHRLVRSVQPAWCLFENVPGLVSLGLDDVLADLDASGYAAWALMVPAAATGAPHLRERIFIVAHSVDDGFARAQLLSRDSGTRYQSIRQTTRELSHAGRAGVAHATECQSGERYDAQGVGGRARVSDGRDALFAAQCGIAHRCRVGLADTDRAGPQGRGHGRAIRQPRAAQPGVGRGPDGLSGGLDGCPVHAWPAGPHEPQHRWEPPRTTTARVPHRAARLKALGNAVVPQQAYPIFAAIVAAWESDA